MATIFAALRSIWTKIVVILGLGAGAFVGGRMTATNKDVALVDVQPKFVAKRGKLNALTVNATVPVKFFTDGPTEYRVCGKDFLFSGEKAFNVWVLYKGVDGEIADPLRIEVTVEGELIPDPKLPDPKLPDPKLPDPKLPVDPTVKAIQTAWQMEFMPSKQTYLPKMIQLFQAMYDRVDTASTYGDVSKVMVEKSKELSLIGVCPILSGAINTEIGKVFPPSPSILIDKAVAKDTLSKVLAALRTLT